MQPLEAMTLLIHTAEKELGLNGTIGTDEPQLSDHEAQLQVATAIAQAMLNTALPVARFRCHVSVEDVGSTSRLGLGDFTITATSIPAIKNGLTALSMENVTVHASLWEQRKTGADMLSGYQGRTKTLQYRNWLKQIDQYEIAQTVQ